MKRRILVIEDNEMVLGLLKFKLQDQYDLFLAKSIRTGKELLKSMGQPDLLILDLQLADGEDGFSYLEEVKASSAYAHVPVIILSGDDKSETRIKCLQAGAVDYIMKPFHPDELQLRISKSLEVKSVAPPNDDIDFPTPKPSWRKRLFDIFFSLMALILLSPLFLIVAILIKLDSKGPVFYFSKRVGAGYTIFNLYKFRTMRTDADKIISQMAGQNAYTKKVETPLEPSTQDTTLIADTGWVSESKLKAEKSSEAAFMKFQNDPRITRLGAFLRNSSIDELPQLINILKGDMSIIGNRPLPLYEAEKLTKDESVARFLAPAGLTGLWQVTKRGKAGLTEEERMELDNTYSKKHNIWMDLKLFFKTFKAVFQSEKM